MGTLRNGFGPDAPGRVTMSNLSTVAITNVVTQSAATGRRTTRPNHPYRMPPRMPAANADQSVATRGGD